MYAVKNGIIITHSTVTKQFYKSMFAAIHNRQLWDTTKQNNGLLHKKKMSWIQTHVI